MVVKLRRMTLTGSEGREIHALKSEIFKEGCHLRDRDADGFH